MSQQFFRPLVSRPQERSTSRPHSPTFRTASACVPRRLGLFLARPPPALAGPAQCLTQWAWNNKAPPTAWCVAAEEDRSSIAGHQPATAVAAGATMNTAARSAASPAKGGAPDASRPLDTGAVTKRLQQELMSLMAGGGDGVSAFPAGDSLFDWVGTINGAEDTAYQGCTFRLSLRFTGEYPFKPPAVRFETPCFHPNVDNYGNICLDILKDKWSAAYSVKTILQSIQSLLADPNVDSPLNAHAAKLWGANDAEYRALVQKTYAGPRPA